MRTLFQIIQQEFQKENDLVLASIVASSGSTPRGAVPDSCPVLQTAPVNIPSVVLFRNFHEDTS